ncbi:hypothetical protein J2S68_002240 [Glycomyces algeriensis]|nr:hypothetical protein [Glycomyces algeriensis]
MHSLDAARLDSSAIHLVVDGHSAHRAKKVAE